MDWDLVLVSAHMGARTGDGGENPGNHSWWQGKIYSRSGKSKKFPPFSLTGYGTASGLSGVNCRHSFGASDGEFNPYTELSAQKQNAAYKDYCKQNDLRELQDRLMIAKWNRQNAAKARGAAKRYKTAKGID